MSNDIRQYNAGPAIQSDDGPTSDNDFLGTLQDAVRANPLPAALIGMGVLWLFMGGKDTSLFGGGGRKSIFGAIGENAQRAGGAVGRAAGQVGAAISSGVDAATDTVAGAARRARDMASTSAGTAAETALSAYDAAGQLASDASNTISGGVTEAARLAKASGAKLGGALQENLTDLLERQPLVLGAIGIAIGAGMASAFPATEVEQQVMGEASDHIQRKFAQASGMAKEVASAALDEVKAQGLSSAKD
jgi:hypothetical protein